MAESASEVLAAACTANHVPPALVPAVVHYLQNLQRWNRVYNLTAVTEPSAMVTRHILDSLSVRPWLHGLQVLDVGSGAGLPGLVLALADRYLALPQRGPQNNAADFVSEHVAERAPKQAPERVQEQIPNHASKPAPGRVPDYFPEQAPEQLSEHALKYTEDDHAADYIEQCPIQQHPIQQRPIQQRPVEQSPDIQSPIEQRPIEQRHYLLLDSRLKRVRFLRQMVAELGLDAVTVVHGRVEDLQPTPGFATVLSRAFAAPAEFVAKAGHCLAAQGRMLAMLGQAAPMPLALPAGWVCREQVPVNIPGLAASRHIAVIERETA